MFFLAFTLARYIENRGKRPLITAMIPNYDLLCLVLGSVKSFFKLQMTFPCYPIDLLHMQYTWHELYAKIDMFFCYAAGIEVGKDHNSWDWGSQIRAWRAPRARLYFTILPNTTFPLSSSSLFSDRHVNSLALILSLGCILLLKCQSILGICSMPWWIPAVFKPWLRSRPLAILLQTKASLIWSTS